MYTILSVIVSAHVPYKIGVAFFGDFEFEFAEISVIENLLPAINDAGEATLRIVVAGSRLLPFLLTRGIHRTESRFRLRISPRIQIQNQKVAVIV